MLLDLDSVELGARFGRGVHPQDVKALDALLAIRVMSSSHCPSDGIYGSDLWYVCPPSWSSTLLYDRSLISLKFE
ncbi:hypothetical protein AKJ16_DCAP03863 [Drosera capensis]